MYYSFHFFKGHSAFLIRAFNFILQPQALQNNPVNLLSALSQG